MPLPPLPKRNIRPMSREEAMMVRRAEEIKRRQDPKQETAHVIKEIKDYVIGSNHSNAKKREVLTSWLQQTTNLKIKEELTAALAKLK